MKRIVGTIGCLCFILSMISCKNDQVQNKVPKKPIPIKVHGPKLFLDSAYLNRTILPFQFKDVSAQEKENLLQEDKTKNALIRLDTFFQSMGKWGDYNGVVLVAKKGVILYEKAFGYARKDTLNSSINTIYQLASVSKTLTATAVLQLIDDKKVFLDSTLSYYIPKFPYRDVTIRQLLSHRSGLPNYLYFTDETYRERPEWDYMNNKELLEYMINCPPPISYPPDHKFIYCNTNYALLASLIEEISGMTFNDYMHKYLFAPLGMKNSFFTTPYRANSNPATAFGYYVNGRSVENNYQDGVYGDKGCYSTAQDLYLFHKALCQGFISKELLEEAYTNAVTEPHRLKKYGLGWRMRFEEDSTKILYHNGWWHGFRTAFHRRSEDESCVILLTNKLNRRIYDAVIDAYYIMDSKVRIYKLEDEESEGAEGAETIDTTAVSQQTIDPKSKPKK